MAHTTAPFAIEGLLSPRLDDLLEAWKAARRGEASMPFSDDLDLAAAEALCSDVFLLGVFERPERFRLDLAHTPNAEDVQSRLVGRFIDEIDLPTPLQFLRAQADATVEGMAPTVYQHRPTLDERAYARLLAPFWGEGQVKLLLGAVEWR